MAAQRTEGRAPVDVALVVVHGIGQQQADSTLFAWAEPLVAELQRRADLFQDEVGVQVPRADADGRSITITVPTGVGTESRRILVAEARWAEAFLTVGNWEVVRWAVIFLPRVLRLVLAHTARMARSALDSAKVEDSQQRAEMAWFYGPTLLLMPARFVPVNLLLVFVMVVVATALTVLLIPVIFAILTTSLLLLLLLSFVPFVRGRVRPLLLSLNSSIGDAAVWTRRPLRAAVMCEVVREELGRARSRARRVVLLGHSQGAAVSAEACLGPNGVPVDVLVTVGGAVNLLNRGAWGNGGGQGSSLVERWAQRPNMRWINAWATWDPVSSGPLGRTPDQARRRWLALRTLGGLREEAEWTARMMRLGVSPAVRAGVLVRNVLASLVGMPELTQSVSRRERRELFLHRDHIRELSRLARHVPVPQGPEEWPLHNRSSIFRDHVTYVRNEEQLMRRLATLLLEEDSRFATDPMASFPARADANVEARYTRAVRAFALLRLDCLPVAALLTTAWFGSAIAWTAGAIGVAATYLPDASGKLWDWAGSWGVANYAALAMVAALTALALTALIRLCEELERRRQWRGGGVLLGAVALVVLAFPCVATLMGWAWWVALGASALVISTPSLTCGAGRLAILEQCREEST